MLVYFVCFVLTITEPKGSYSFKTLPSYSCQAFVTNLKADHKGKGTGIWDSGVLVNHVCGAFELVMFKVT